MSVVDIATRRVDRIVIDTGIYKSGRDRGWIGRRVYWVEHVSADGGTCMLWMGISYAEACRGAAEWAAEGVPVSDRTGGMHG